MTKPNSALQAGGDETPVAWMRKGTLPYHDEMHNFRLDNPSHENWLPLFTRPTPAAAAGVPTGRLKGCRRCDGNGSIETHPSYAEPTERCPDCGGTGIASPVAPAGVPTLADEQIEALAHRMAWRYRQLDPEHKRTTYLFTLHTLLDFARAVLSAGAPAVPLQDSDSVHSIADDGQAPTAGLTSQTVGGSTAAPTEVGAPLWQPIETAPKGRKVLAGYRNKLGKWRTVTACYYLPHTLQMDDDSYDLDDDGYAPEGWYEECESQEHILPTECVPTHWMPLPLPPIQSHGRDGVTDSAASSEAAKPLTSNEQDGPESSAAGMAQDAARYRWLRDESNDSELAPFYGGEALDEAIDAALRALPHQPTGERE